MTPRNGTLSSLIGTLIILAAPGFSAQKLNGAKLSIREGRSVVDGVMVNGHGPYRFLLDTGANVNLIETKLAKKIGMEATLHLELASMTNKTPTTGSDGNEVALDSVKADKQEFLYSDLDAIHLLSPDIQGVLGQWFLARFDYTIDLRNKRIEFGKQDREGARTPFRFVNARPVVSTSLGRMALDSGAARLVLFGVHPDEGSATAQLYSVAGSQQIGMVSTRPLTIDGRKIWQGDAVAIPTRNEPGVDGLLPLSLFRAIYVSNSESYVILQ
jgi:hypothetical protein